MTQNHQELGGKISITSSREIKGIIKVRMEISKTNKQKETDEKMHFCRFLKMKPKLVL